MADRTLQDCRIFIAEDEYMLADELRMALEDAGAVVLGPSGTVGDAIDLINREEKINGAVLDVNLRGEMIYSAADLLTQRGVPFVFTTGYDETIFPVRFEHIARCEKPVNFTQVTRAIEGVLSNRS